MSTPSISGAGAALRFRAPAGVFAVLGFMIVLGGGLAGVVWAASGLSRFDPLLAEPLSVPVTAATLLAGLELWPRLRKGRMRRRLAVSLRAGLAFAAIGAAWPLAYDVSGWLAGAPGAMQGVWRPMALGAAVGAGAGGIAGSLAAALCLTRAPSP